MQKIKKPSDLFLLLGIMELLTGCIIFFISINVSAFNYDNLLSIIGIGISIGGSYTLVIGSFIDFIIGEEFLNKKNS